MPYQFRQHDHGFVLELRFQESGQTVAIDTATTLEFVFVDPKGNTTARAGSLVTDGTDGLLEYRVQPGDFPSPGKWRCYGHLVFPIPNDPPNVVDLYSEEVLVDVQATYGRSSA